ncbi:aminoacyl-histidine dipeptidase [Vreelandella jeotgali]|uniref:aminoacyl-histidine dipeptidase n=1 Tax=Vreelandella jeotgali TaxID=553386 RepID=UPI00034844CF|nr:aminoacyl-histidine dipeptidase [Halomonas jeotgali]
MNEHLDALAPVPVWRHFRTLCNTPRPSGHEEALVAALEAWADERGLAHDSDAFGNLRIQKPAAKGSENAPGVILQGHLDMVAQANADRPHDFTRDPISTYVADGWLHADGTTLGADNGLGVAAALALLESTDVAHGPLEALFTLEEETSMGGALALAEDWLEGSLLLNLDSEEGGEAYIGCAGGSDVVVDARLPQTPVESHERCLDIALTGLQGGHSGMDIHRPLGNANRLLMRVLRMLEFAGARLVSYQGGTLRNAIPREAFVRVALPADEVDAVTARMPSLEATLRSELGRAEAPITLSVTPTAAENVPAEALNPDASAMLVAALHAAPCGVERMSAEVDGVVETSNNLGVLQLEDGRFHLCALVRSLHDSAVAAMTDRFRALFGLIGARVKAENAYPGWVPDPQSPLLQSFIDCHRSLQGGEPAVKVIHAGLECGILGSKYPGLDMISFGPTIRGAHSPDERVEIASVDAFWAQLKALAEALGRQTAA